MSHRPWTPAEERILRTRYPHEPTADVAAALGRSVLSVYNHAYQLRLVKSAAYLASPAAYRTNGRQGIGTRFPKGHVPANKGLRRPGWGPGRMKATQFKKGTRNGRAARIYRPIGTVRVSKDGYLQQKVNDDLPLQARWRAVHVILWEAAHGPVLPGHAVVFRNGDQQDIRLDNLECLTRRALLARNSVHNYPQPLAATIQLLGALHRQIRKRTRHASQEQDERSSRPPV